MDILKGKTAIIIGSSSGIGKAFTLLFGKEEAKIALLLVSDSILYVSENTTGR
ncbi:hypothetical protein [Parabacteroides pacaensis]|uniref:hypothetical protein n=1 Tax=Parabacteroides pacaensis TaxID=2086575 RepID=UPI00131CD075|nr:hypothetical protein [Parabacteroides pacaensis]